MVLGTTLVLGLEFFGYFYKMVVLLPSHLMVVSNGGFVVLRKTLILGLEFVNVVIPSFEMVVL